MEEDNRGFLGIFMLKNMDDLIDLTIEEVLDVLQIDHHLFERRGSSELERVIEKKG